MATEVRTQHYTTITEEIHSLLRTGKYAYINIYSDSDGTIFAKDTKGNTIDRRQIKSISNTAPYIDAVTNKAVNGFLLLTFSDDSEFKEIDDLDFYWYKIEGTPFEIRKLD